MRSTLALAFLVPALVAYAAVEDNKTSPKVAQDEAMEAMAKKAMVGGDEAQQREALRALKAHRFRSTRAPEREYALFAQGILEDRFETVAKASETLKKLERAWPHSPYLPESQTILGQEAVDRRRFKEAEIRLRKALHADVPVEGKRRAQELLLWVFVEQSHPEKGLPVLDSLYPLGTAKPSERGLVAMVEILAAAKRRDQAEGARKDYQSIYPKGPFTPRVELAFGRMLGSLGDSKASAEVLQHLLLEAPSSTEADEARLALATLISEGKLKPEEAKAFPNADQLLSEIKQPEKKENLNRRALVVRLRMQVNASRWKEALDTAALIRSKEPTEEEAAVVATLRQGAFQAWTQELLDKQQLDPLLGYLDREGIESLAPEQRSVLAIRLAKVGLPSAALTLADLAPKAEQPSLRKGILQSTQAEANPTETLQSLPRSPESAEEALKRAQAGLALKDWKTVRSALGRATPGSERISILTGFLRRPLEAPESGRERRKEAEAWLARAPEKGSVRHPLVILVADLRVQDSDWRGALALYPPEAAKDQCGWVALMRATCQLKLGLKDAAKNTLKQVQDEPGFKMERDTLARQLGM